MDKYDVVVIGAGPAGGQCARELSRERLSVFLAERGKDFLENNFSSGGAPLSVLSEFELPESTVGTHWNTFRMISTNANSSWSSPTSFGPVFDFDKLRTFLTDETIKNGGEFCFGCRYLGHKIFPDGVEVYLKDLNSSDVSTVKTSVLVDATGTERKVLAQNSYNKEKAVAATGIEYHIEVEKNVHDQYAHALNFFLGHHWMPQGYAWIFPMSNSRLKIGVIRYFQNKNYVPYNPSYHYYINQLLALCEPCSILDKHGKTVYYTKGQKDVRFNGPVIAIGDAVSSVNTLGWEGIRHALYTGRFAAQAILAYLKNPMKGFNSYESALNHYFGYKWLFSEMYMNYLFKTKHDHSIDQTVRAFGRMNNEEIMQVLFEYKFRYALKSHLKEWLNL